MDNSIQQIIKSLSSGQNVLELPPLFNEQLGPGASFMYLFWYISLTLTLKQAKDNVLLLESGDEIITVFIVGNIMFSTVKLSVQCYCSLICKLFKFIRGVRNVPFILYSNLLKFSDQPCVHVSFVVRRQLLFFIICFLFRSEIKKLIIRLNDEKEVLKKKGIYVDGKHYQITFKGLQMFLLTSFYHMPT